MTTWSRHLVLAIQLNCVVIINIDVNIMIRYKMINRNKLSSFYFFLYGFICFFSESSKCVVVSKLCLSNAWWGCMLFLLNCMKCTSWKTTVSNSLDLWKFHLLVLLKVILVERWSFSLAFIRSIFYRWAFGIFDIANVNWIFRFT